MKMREKITIMLGLLGLWACSSDDAAQGNDYAGQERAVGFAAHFDSDGTYGAAKTRVTRAAGDGELTDELLKEQGFGVYCWYTGSTIFDATFTAPKTHMKDFMGDSGYMLMRNQKVEWKKWDGVTDTWGYTPEKYWPLDPSELLTLRAYAPYTDYLVTNANGMPMLPVVVENTDYANGTQHDPLWGTGKHDGATDNDDAATDNEKYGKQYDNYTYQMSGDKLAADARDGVIDWYFHHGMSKLGFTVALSDDPGCTSVTITQIVITPLYTQGLLDLGSQTRTSSEKPTWDDRSGDMTVTIACSKEVAANAADPILLLEKGLLIIPRDFTSSEVSISLSYYIDNDDSNVLVATATLNRNFQGNTTYNLGLKLTPETKALDIDVVLSAFTKWKEGAEGNHEVYNW